MSQSIADCRLPIANYKEPDGYYQAIGNWQSEIDNDSQ
jgi:hypothetical protein